MIETPRRPDIAHEENDRDENPERALAIFDRKGRQGVAAHELAQQTRRDQPCRLRDTDAKLWDELAETRANTRNAEVAQGRQPQDRPESQDSLRKGPVLGSDQYMPPPRGSKVRLPMGSFGSLRVGCGTSTSEDSFLCWETSAS